MIAEAFLICALAPQPMSIAHADSRAAIGAYHLMQNEEERLKDWLRKHNEIDEVFIHPEPQEDKLRQHGWERVPFTINGKKIWIKRKPKSDQGQKLIETAA